MAGLDCVVSAPSDLPLRVKKGKVVEETSWLPERQGYLSLYLRLIKTPHYIPDAWAQFRALGVQRQVGSPPPTTHNAGPDSWGKDRAEGPKTPQAAHCDSLCKREDPANCLWEGAGTHPRRTSPLTGFQISGPLKMGKVSGNWVQRGAWQSWVSLGSIDPGIPSQATASSGEGPEEA